MQRQTKLPETLTVVLNRDEIHLLRFLNEHQGDMLLRDAVRAFVHATGGYTHSAFKRQKDVDATLSLFGRGGWLGVGYCEHPPYNPAYSVFDRRANSGISGVA